MNKHQCGFLVVFLLIISLGIVSLVSCFIAESKKAKKEDVKLDNKLCFLPESRTFWYGIAAMNCLVIAQIIGSLIICSNFCSKRDATSSKSKRPKIGITFWVLSWISFGGAMILLGAATSMSRKQGYGRGWLDQECFLVKDGVFMGSGILVIVSIAATLGSAISTITTPKGLEQGKKNTCTDSIEEL